MNTNTTSRLWLYFALAIGLVFTMFARAVSWQGNTQLHTLMEATGTLLALIVGAVAMVRFYSKKNNTYLLIGVGFFGTAFLDGDHAIATSSVSPFFPALSGSREAPRRIEQSITRTDRPKKRNRPTDRKIKRRRRTSHTRAIQPLTLA